MSDYNLFKQTNIDEHLLELEDQQKKKRKFYFKDITPDIKMLYDLSHKDKLNSLHFYRYMPALHWNGLILHEGERISSLYQIRRKVFSPAEVLVKEIENTGISIISSTTRAIYRKGLPKIDGQSCQIQL